jgi:hypothetical protein
MVNGTKDPPERSAVNWKISRDQESKIRSQESGVRSQESEFGDFIDLSFYFRSRIP